MSLTLESARVAKISLREKIADITEVSSIGIERLPNGFRLKVNLSRKLPNSIELPQSCRGVPIRYEVIGRVKALQGSDAVG